MQYRISLTTCLILCIVMVPKSHVFAQSTKEIQRAGDMLQFAIPLTAFGMTDLFDDQHGRRNLAYTFFSIMGATYALKYSFPDERPDGSDHLSFISGHTSAAFSGATFIHVVTAGNTAFRPTLPQPLSGGAGWNLGSIIAMMSCAAP